MVTPSHRGRSKLNRVRTYSHALLTFAAARYRRPEDAPFAAWATLGATVPDLPAGAGIAWLWTRRRLYSRQDFLKEVCGRSVFRKPDAALHSALPVAVALCALPSIKKPGSSLSAFLLGWTGHVVADALTHGSDARPLLWPVSGWRFESPVSYRERGRYGRLFTLFEHIALVVAAERVLCCPAG